MDPRAAGRSVPSSRLRRSAAFEASTHVVGSRKSLARPPLGKTRFVLGEFFAASGGDIDAVLVESGPFERGFRTAEAKD